MMIEPKSWDVRSQLLAHRSLGEGGNYAPSCCSITDSGDAGGTKSGACGGVLIQAASAFAGCGSIQGAESCKISCGGKGIEVTFQAYFSSLCTSFVASPLEYCILLNLCYNITI